MAPQLSPSTRTSAVTIPRQLAPTMGPVHGGFEFLQGNFEGIKGYAMGQMTKCRRGKLYIDDAGLGPEAGSIEYGYRVPFGGIHGFIGKIGEPGPEPDICTDIVETAQHARPARVQPAVKRAFTGVIHGAESEDRSVSGGETVVYSDDESSTGETESLNQLQDGRISGGSDGDSIPDLPDPPSRVAIFMASTQSVEHSSTAAAVISSSAAATPAGAGGSAPPPAQALSDLFDTLAMLLAAEVDAVN